MTCQESYIPVTLRNSLINEKLDSNPLSHFVIWKKKKKAPWLPSSIQVTSFLLRATNNSKLSLKKGIT